MGALGSVSGGFGILIQEKTEGFKALRELGQAQPESRQAPQFQAPAQPGTADSAIIIEQDQLVLSVQRKILGRAIAMNESCLMEAMECRSGSG